MSATVTVEDVQASIEQGQLVVRFAVRNGTGRPVHLANRLSTYGAAGPEVQAERAYARLEGDTLVLRQGPMQVPQHIDVEVPEAPYLTALAVGGTHPGHIRLPVPVDSDDPYAPNPAGAVVATGLLVEVGWVEGVEVEQQRTVAGAELWAYPTEVVRRSQLARSEPVELTVPTAMGSK